MRILDLFLPIFHGKCYNNDINIILFGPEASIEIIKKYINNIPIYYTKRGILSLSVALFNFIRSGANYKSPSFDVIERKTLELLVKEYNLDFDDYFLQTIDPDLDENDYIKKHLELYEASKADCIFTAFEYTFF